MYEGVNKGMEKDEDDERRNSNAPEASVCDGTFEFRMSRRGKGRVVSECSELFTEGASFLFHDLVHGISSIKREEEEQMTYQVKT
jgi:hypothetical protein